MVELDKLTSAVATGRGGPAFGSEYQFLRPR